MRGLHTRSLRCRRTGQLRQARRDLVVYLGVRQHTVGLHVQLIAAHATSLEPRRRASLAPIQRRPRASPALAASAAARFMPIAANRCDDVAQGGGVPVDQRAGVRQRQPADNAIDVLTRSARCRRSPGCRRAARRRAAPAAPPPTARHARRCAPPRGPQRPPRACPVRADIVHARAKREFRREQHGLQSVPRLRAGQRLSGLDRRALLAERLGQQHPRQRAPRVAGRRQCRCRPAQQPHRGLEVPLRDQHIGNQHLTDRAARLLQLREVGQLLTQRLRPVQLAGHHQRCRLAESTCESQQSRMSGRDRAFGQRVDVGEAAHPCRAQRGGRRRPADRGVIGRRRRQHLLGDLRGATGVARVHRERRR